MIKLIFFGTYEKMPDYPPPPPSPPSFLVYTSLALFSLLFLAKEVLDKLNQAPPQLLPPPTFLSLSINYLLLTLTILANTDRSGTLINQLFSNFRGIRNRGRDVWQILELNPIVFWYMTGETQEMAEAMVEKVYLDVTAPRHLPRTPRTDRRRRCIPDVRNRVLLVIIWLRQYLKLYVLAHMFQISKSTVAEEIYHIVPVVILNFRHYITWHSLQKWRELLNSFYSFPNAVGMMDGTIHQINRPSNAEKAEFYRGDKRCHFMSTQFHDQCPVHIREQGNQLTAEENHDCCSLHETLLQSELKMAFGSLL